MERFKFVSDRGKITVGRGGYVFTSVENLNGAETTMQTDTFTNRDGAEYSRIQFGVPIMQIKGFINASSMKEFQRLRADLYGILNGKEKGVLYYHDGIQEYFTEVLPDAPQIGERVQYNASFVLYFRRYNVYWKSNRPNKRDVYSVTKRLKTTFSLPCVFSARTYKTDAVNYGDVEAYPIITLPCNGINDANVTDGVGFTVHNKTTGAYLHILHDMAAGEIITVDMENCKVSSSTAGDILNKVTADSNFFVLFPGKNEIEVENHNAACELSASIKFYCRFLGV